MGEAALKNLDLKIATEAFIKSQNYLGIQLVSDISDLGSNPIRKAIVATYFKNFDEAEKIYSELDRRYFFFFLNEDYLDLIK